MAVFWPVSAGKTPVSGQETGRESAYRHRNPGSTRAASRYRVSSRTSPAVTLPLGGAPEEEEGSRGFAMDVLRLEDRHPLPSEALDVRRPPFL